MTDLKVMKWPGNFVRHRRSARDQGRDIRGWQDRCRPIPTPEMTVTGGIEAQTKGCRKSRKPCSRSKVRA